MFLFTFNTYYNVQDKYILKEKSSYEARIKGNAEATPDFVLNHLVSYYTSKKKCNATFFHIP